jgi:hypothetical protein
VEDRMSNDGDNYLRNIINNNKASIISIDDYRLSNIKSIIYSWAGYQLSELIKSGSSVKGTAIKGVSDIDLFISLKSDTNGTLKEIYNSLDDFVKSKYIITRRQNVSIGITQSGLEIDLVPGKKQSGYQNFHSIYVSKKDTWSQTNIQSNIDLINNSNRKDEIILTKIWRKNHNLDFLSIYLELIVLESLEYKQIGDLSNNFWTVLTYLRDEFVDKRIIDPSNTNNIISDVLYKYEKEAIAAKAKESISKQYWSEIVC